MGATISEITIKLKQLKGIRKGNRSWLGVGLEIEGCAAEGILKDSFGKFTLSWDNTVFVA